jgi:hypothetical protein
MTGKDLGKLLALLAALVFGYEYVAIEDGAGGVPTISRILQGLRDLGAFGEAIVFVVVVAIAAGMLIFLKWLAPHLLRGKRSEL